MLKDIFFSNLLESSCPHLIFFFFCKALLWSFSTAVNLVFLAIITFCFRPTCSCTFKLNYITRVADIIATKGLGSTQDCFLVPGSSCECPVPQVTCCRHSACFQGWEAPGESSGSSCCRPLPSVYCTPQIVQPLERPHADALMRSEVTDLGLGLVG